MTTNQATALAQRSRRPRGQHPNPLRDPQEKVAQQLPNNL